MHESVFLKVETGDYVVIGKDSGQNANEESWMGKVIHIVESPRGCEPSLFQVVNIESGKIHIVNADRVISLSIYR